MSEGVAARLSGRLAAFTLDVAFTAPHAAVTALVGPSGSGKSTVLRALAGLERLAGEVRVGGETWQAEGRFVQPHRRAVGYVFQHGALLPHLSVRGNLEYARRRARSAPAELERSVALLGLGGLLDRAPARLSGGERQRAALARALLTRPRLLLLDEPLSGLDAEAKAALLPDLRDVFSGLELPVIYVSHDPAEVARVADVVLRLDGGRMLPAPVGPAIEDVLAGRSAAEISRLAVAALQAGLAPAPEPTPPRG